MECAGCLLTYLLKQVPSKYCLSGESVELAGFFPLCNQSTPDVGIHVTIRFCRRRLSLRSAVTGLLRKEESNE